jgi:hypothetical protein
MWGGVSDEFKFHLISWFEIMYFAIFRRFGGYESDLVQLSLDEEMALALCHREVGSMESGGGS